MYHVLSESENEDVGIKITGKLTKDDYDLLIPYLARLKHEVGPIRLLCDMTECEGLNSQALWEDLSRQLQQFQEIIRIAIVGDHLWMECGTKVFHPLFKTSVHYFLPEQLAMAWSWVKEGKT